MDTQAENQQKQPQAPLLMNETQAAEVLTASPHSLRQSRQTGLLWGEPAPKYLKIGNRVRYRPSDLEDWLSQFVAINNTAQG